MTDTKPGEGAEVTPTSTDINQVPQQTPLEQELEREKGKTPRTEAEKAAHALQQNAKRAKELGLEPAAILGIKPVDPKGTVMTVEMYEERERERGQKTALQLAEEITDPHERELTKKYLTERIKPSGDPHEDLRFARLAVNSVKNAQVAEEIARGGKPAAHTAAPGAPARQTPPEAELTADELAFTRPPFNLSKEEIIAKRPK